MEFLARMEPDAISTLYREYSGYPTPISAFVTANDYMALLNGTSFTLCTEWSQTETVRGARLHYAQQWTLIQNYSKETDIDIQPPSPCSLLHSEFLSSYSLSGDLKAVVRVTSGQVVVQQFLEVWSNSCLKKILDLTALNKHGRVYEDAQFGCLAWSTCESRLLYVAEGKRSIGESYASASSPSAGEPRAGPSEGPSEKDKSVYWEDWGEGLTSKSVPVLCVADVAKGTVTVLQGVPSHVSPGQGLWAHDGESVFFVGWWHEPFRLGLRFCSNRRSALFCLDLEGNCECLSGDTSSVSSPRLSPDGRYLVYLEGQVFGPHSQCLSMQQYDLETRKISVLVDVVNRPKKDEFAGLYEALPPRCWASDSQRVVFSSARRNWRDLFVVDRTTRRVTRMSDSEKFGSWKLLTIQNDLMVVHCSHLNEAPRLVIQYCGHSYIALGIQVTPIQRSGHSGYPYTEVWAFRLPLYRGLGIQVTPIQRSGHSGYPYTEVWAFRLPLYRGLGIQVTPIQRSGHSGYPYTEVWAFRLPLYRGLGIQVTPIQRSGHSGYPYTEVWAFRLPLYRGLGIQVTPIQRSGHSGYPYTEVWAFRLPLYRGLGIQVTPIQRSGHSG
ncbi:acylamino-acid-releasing enzyme isoform X2 [Salmo salar]|uniref:Acylamino-acid-releasing enzyme isoform X2 n=1 Tax=Salmo salar TaxID=8030 RepID=A0ABM3CZF4_SALSA|nr:S9 family peptidase isoform X2 [Salmo salar]